MSNPKYLNMIRHHVWHNDCERYSDVPVAEARLLMREFLRSDAFADVISEALSEADDETCVAILTDYAYSDPIDMAQQLGRTISVAVLKWAHRVLEDEFAQTVDDWRKEKEDA